MKTTLPNKSTDAWQEQFFRVKRWRERLRVDAFEQLTKGILGVDPNWQPDIIYAFFLNCHHLADWIAKSGIASKDELNQFVNANHELCVCADIANGSKHLLLDRPPRTSGWSFVWKADMQGNSIENAPSTIKTDDKCYDVQSLADRCMTLWMDFVQSKLGSNGTAFLWTVITK